jgi:hypothetical protein
MSASYSVTSGGLGGLVDQPAEPILPHDSSYRHERNRLARPERRHLAQGTLRAMQL